MSQTITTTFASIVYLIIAMLVASVLATSVSAHGGGGAIVIDPADKNCMGQLASLHAKDDGGQKNSMETRPHPGFDGPHETVKDQMKAFKAYCDAE